MKWYEGDVEAAVVECRTKGAMLLVYIKGSDRSSEEMDEAWDNLNISDKFEATPSICLRLIVDSVAGQQFSAIYPVSKVPTTYFIRPNGQVAQIIAGACSKEELEEKIDQVFAQDTSVGAGASFAASAPTSAAATSESDVRADHQTGAELGASADSGASAGAPTETEDEMKKHAEEKQAKLERARELIKLKQEKRSAEEREKALNAETERRQLGKDLNKLKDLKAEHEAKEARDARKKDKEETRIAREKIREQIQKDREARNAKYQQEKAAKEEALRQRQQEKLAQEAEEAARIAALNSSNARIQFRLPDGSRINQTFEADQLLQSAIEFMATHESNSLGGNFRLATIYPRRVFTTADYTNTFRDLALVPTSALLVLPPMQGGDGARSSSAVSSSANSLVTMLFSPFLWLWNLLQTFIFAKPQQPPAGQPPAGLSSGGYDRSTAGAGGGAPSDTNSARRRVGRLTDIPPDEDDQNTWNGNSTQQM